MSLNFLKSTARTLFVALVYVGIAASMMPAAQAGVITGSCPGLPPVPPFTTFTCATGINELSVEIFTDPGVTLDTETQLFDVEFRSGSYSDLFTNAVPTARVPYFLNDPDNAVQAASAMAAALMPVFGANPPGNFFLLLPFTGQATAIPYGAAGTSVNLLLVNRTGTVGGNQTISAGSSQIYALFERIEEVPVPGTLALFLMGLCALVRIRTVS